MNNLHRELAPISSSAWEQIEEEVARTFKRSVAGRRVVDVDGPEGPELSAVGTGHLVDVAAPRELVNARLREVRTIVELTVPFELSRDAIDSVERGARDADWQPAKDAAQRLAFAEDDAIFDGYRAAGILGIREGTSNRKLTLPADVSAYPDAISDALEALRLAGVDGPYSVVLGSDAYTALSEARDQAIRSSAISSGSSAARSSGRRRSAAAACCPRAAAITSCTSGKTYRSATRAIPTRSSACTCAKRSRS